MQYRVVIEEQIMEQRAYLVEADSPEQAAKEASNMWLVLAKEAHETHMCVEERFYTVMTPSKDLSLGCNMEAHEVLLACDSCEVEDE